MKNYIKIFLLATFTLFNSQLFSACVWEVFGQVPLRRFATAASQWFTTGINRQKACSITQRAKAQFQNISVPFTLPEEVKLTGVTARDGFQGRPKTKFSIEDRVGNILSESGIFEPGKFYRQEYGSCIKPDLLPGISQPELVVGEMLRRGLPPTAQRISILVPNMHGFRAFAKLFNNVPTRWEESFEVAFFTSSCPEFLVRNTGFSSIEAHLEVAQNITIEARKLGADFMRVFISMALRSPFHGDDLTPRTIKTCEQLHKMGYTEIVPADTNGLASLEQIILLFSTLQKLGIPKEALGFHAHDLGNGIENVVAALPFINTIDVATSGIGGCPFSPGSPGNMNTRLVADTFRALGVATGVRYPELASAEQLLSKTLAKYEA